MGETSKRHNHYADMHAAMRGHAAAVPSGNILKARAVEQGSVIVAAPPDGIAVVLQLPRGNLETVYPRSLVLPAVASAVQVGTLSCGKALCGSSMGHCWVRGVFCFLRISREGRRWPIPSVSEAFGCGILLFKQTGTCYSWTVTAIWGTEPESRRHLAAWDGKGHANCSTHTASQVTQGCVLSLHLPHSQADKAAPCRCLTLSRRGSWRPRTGST